MKICIHLYYILYTTNYNDRKFPESMSITGIKVIHITGLKKVACDIVAESASRKETYTIINIRIGPNMHPTDGK